MTPVLLIREAGPQSRPVMITIFSHALSIRPYVRFHKTMVIATVGTVVMVKWIMMVYIFCLFCFC